MRQEQGQGVLVTALGPSLAGWMLGAATFAWPLLLAGAL